MPSLIHKGNELKEIDLLDFVPIYEAVVNQWYGKIRSGKTYSATSFAIQDLEQGNVVYTSWKINWEGYDERKRFWPLLLGALGLKKQFICFPKENLHYLPFESDDKRVYYPYTNFMDKFMSLTDCNVFLDEGQVPFNSYEKTNLSQEKQNSILFTGHLNRTINIISQRPVAIHAVMRANISRYYKLEVTFRWRNFVHFKRSEIQETDGNNLPDETKIESEETYWGKKRIYQAYDSKYMRGDKPQSQTNNMAVYKLNRKEAWENLRKKDLTDTSEELY